MLDARRGSSGTARALISAVACVALAMSMSACGATDTVETAAAAAPIQPVAAVQPAATCAGPATVAAPPTVLPIAQQATPVLPTTITDATGAPVEVRSAERILAVGGSGTLATTVYALGLGHRLVGRDAVTLLPELADLPQVTVNAHELSAEKMLELAPDLVLADPSAGPPEVIDQLRSSGIPVVTIATPPAAAAIGHQIREVAAVFGLTELGDRLAQRVGTELSAVQQRIDALTPADGQPGLRTAFLYLRGASGLYMWLGAGTGADELIRALHGTDVADTARSRTPLNAEAVAAAQPQRLLLMSRGLASVGGVEGLRSVAGIGQTEAGRTGCIVDLPDHLALAFGPMFPAVLDALVTAVHGQAPAA